MNLQITTKESDSCGPFNVILLVRKDNLAGVEFTICIYIFFSFETLLDLMLNWIVLSFLTRDLIPIIRKFTGTKHFSRIYCQYHHFIGYTFQNLESQSNRYSGFG